MGSKQYASDLLVNTMPRIKTNRREEVQNQIIMAAFEVAHEKDWDAVTLDLIAQHIGVTKPALYSYFESRDMLIRSVLLKILEKLTTAIGSLVAQEIDIRHFIRALADILVFEMGAEDPIFFQINPKLFQEKGSLEELKKHLDFVHDQICATLVRAQAKGELSRELDPSASTTAIMMMTMGVRGAGMVFNQDPQEIKTIWITSVERLLLLEPAGD